MKKSIISGSQGLSMHKAKATTSGLDKDKLLATVFPNGVPANWKTLLEVDNWLDEAERLHENAK